MVKKKLSIPKRIKKIVLNRLLTGFLVILPIYVTFSVIKFLFNYIGAKFVPVLEKLFHNEIAIPDPVLETILVIVGIFITFAALYMIGLFASNFLGKQIITFYERIINNTPIVKNIYSSSKQIIHTFSTSKEKSFKRVVLVEYPRKGMNVVGFVTNSITNKDGKSLTSVFIPTTPNPTSGFLIYLPKEEIFDTNMTVEEAIKLVISGGILVPKDLNFQMAEYQTKKIENS
ncbi:MAG: DUF502 domain-containing protein [Candidatus Anammoxibacter sp.]